MIAMSGTLCSTVEVKTVPQPPRNASHGSWQWLGGFCG